MRPLDSEYGESGTRHRMRHKCDNNCDLVMCSPKPGSPQYLPVGPNLQGGHGHHQLSHLARVTWRVWREVVQRGQAIPQTEFLFPVLPQPVWEAQMQEGVRHHHTVLQNHHQVLSLCPNAYSKDFICVSGKVPAGGVCTFSLICRVEKAREGDINSISYVELLGLFFQMITSKGQ